MFLTVFTKTESPSMSSLPYDEWLDSLYGPDRILLLHAGLGSLKRLLWVRQLTSDGGGLLFVSIV
jgi:hypothetical protein